MSGKVRRVNWALSNLLIESRLF